jgi:hypothetical protein
VPTYRCGHVSPVAKKPEGPVLPTGPAVWMYVSLTSQSYFVKAGLDGSVRSLVWETFLRKYKIPYARITAVDLLEQIPAQGVLLLPSNAALSDREMAAIRAAQGAWRLCADYMVDRRKK